LIQLRLCFIFWEYGYTIPVNIKRVRIIKDRKLNSYNKSNKALNTYSLAGIGIGGIIGSSSLF